jgi:hypothetical protein
MKKMSLISIVPSMVWFAFGSPDRRRQEHQKSFGDKAPAANSEYVRKSLANKRRCV